MVGFWEWKIGLVTQLSGREMGFRTMLKNSRIELVTTFPLLNIYSEATHKSAIRVSNSPHAEVVSNVKGLNNRKSHANWTFFGGCSDFA